MKKKRAPAPLAIQCQVCSAPAPEHLHFGGHCCYSCRAFFRRTALKAKTADMLRCRAGTRDCLVNENHKDCIACRFSKCLQIGMRTSLMQGTKRRREKEPKPEKSSCHGQEYSTLQGNAEKKNGLGTEPLVCKGEAQTSPLMPLEMAQKHKKPSRYVRPLIETGTGTNAIKKEVSEAETFTFNLESSTPLLRPFQRTHSDQIPCRFVPPLSETALVTGETKRRNSVISVNPNRLSDQEQLRVKEEEYVPKVRDTVLKKYLRSPYPYDKKINTVTTSARPDFWIPGNQCHSGFLLGTRDYLEPTSGTCVKKKYPSGMISKKRFLPGTIGSQEWPSGTVGMQRLPPRTISYQGFPPETISYQGFPPGTLGNYSHESIVTQGYPPGSTCNYPFPPETNGSLGFPPGTNFNHRFPPRTISNQEFSPGAIGELLRGTKLKSGIEFIVPYEDGAMIFSPSQEKPVFNLSHSYGSPEYILGDTAGIEQTPRPDSTWNIESDVRFHNDQDQEQLVNAISNHHPSLGFNNNPQAVVTLPCTVSDPHASRTEEYLLVPQPAQRLQPSLQQFESKTSPPSMLRNEDILTPDETGCSNEKRRNPLHKKVEGVAASYVSPPISGATVNQSHADVALTKMAESVFLPEHELPKLDEDLLQSSLFKTADDLLSNSLFSFFVDAIASRLPYVVDDVIIEQNETVGTGIPFHTNHAATVANSNPSNRTAPFLIQPNLKFTVEELKLLDGMKETHSQEMGSVVRLGTNKLMIDSLMGKVSRMELFKSLAAGKGLQTYNFIRLTSKLPHFQDLTASAQRRLIQENMGICWELRNSVFFWGHTATTIIEQEEQTGIGINMKQYITNYRPEASNLTPIHYDFYYRVPWMDVSKTQLEHKRLTKQMGASMRGLDVRMFPLLFAIAFYMIDDDILTTKASFTPKDVETVKKVQHQLRIVYRRFMKHNVGWKRALSLLTDQTRTLATLKTCVASMAEERARQAGQCMQAGREMQGGQGKHAGQLM